MIVGLLVAASVSAQAPPAAALDPVIIEDAAHAIDVGRLREARLLIGRAAAAGVTGQALDRVRASFAFASGQYLQALRIFQRLAASTGKQQSIDCEKGAISALKLGMIDDAKPLAECAVSGAGASWRAWNARGVLADAMRDWASADEAFARARELAPDEAGILNNQGWSRLLRGEWVAAVPLFEEAVRLDPTSTRSANNLQLANDALGAELPQRRAGESDRDWAVRLNDAGVAAEILGERQRAVAAFTQALDASPSWYARASNNLQVLSQN